jgi:RNA polymerase sigma-70 factor (ECF subfamily)
MPPHTDQARWFADELQPHEPELRGYLRGSFPAVRDVDDVVQESYLRVWRARVSQPIRSGRSFLFQVARRIAIDFARRERISPLVPASDAVVASALAGGVDCAEAAARADDLDLLARAFEAMPPRRREVMILRKIEGVPQKEIAARLGITEAAVQIHVVRGLRGLEEFFDGCDERRPLP